MSIRWTLAQRASLAQTCAAHMFLIFSTPENRGENWTPDSVPRLLASHVKTQCMLNCISEKYREETCKLAVDFYNLYLHEAMKKLSL